MSTKDEPGPFDGLERAEPDEPVFPLRAKDILAAPLVREWVDRKRRLITDDDALSDDKRKLELIQCAEADEIAMAMDDWRLGRVAVDEAEQDRQAQQRKGGKKDGVEMTAQELAVKAQFDARRKAGEVLANVVAELAGVVETLKPYGFAEERDMMGTLSRLLGESADRIKPKRASYAHLAPEGQQII